MADWANVLFVDETRISLRGNDGRAPVYRARGERFNENCVVETEPFGGGSIMMVLAYRCTPKHRLFAFKEQ